jgi:hypothetical protein
MIGLFVGASAVGSSALQPAGAKAWNFNRRLQFIDFTTQAPIDINNTNQSAYQFFVNMALSDGWGAGAPVTPSSAFTTVANGTNIAISTQDNSSMFSLSDRGLGASPNNYYDLEFSAGAGFYIEFNAAIDKSLESSEHTAFWMAPREAMTGSRGSGNWVEDDILEIVDSSGTMLQNLHRWANSVLKSSLVSGSQNFGTLNDTNLHTYGRAAIPASLNGGLSKREIWLDGVHQTANDVIFSASGTCAQCTDNTTVGMYSEADGDHYVVIVGGPVTLKSIQVWGP